MRTVVFVDGFNLYRGLLRGRPQLKWLDLYKLFQEHVLSDAHVSAVKFFTADIGAISVDDPGSPLRQRSYLKALAEYRKNVDIIRGKFVSHKRNLRLAAPVGGLPVGQSVLVKDYDEKGTDVAIAVGMIDSARDPEVRQIVLCSNDSDLVAALDFVRERFPHVRLGLVAPVLDERHIVHQLQCRVHWSKKLAQVHLERSQLPNHIPHTAFRRPKEWSESFAKSDLHDSTEEVVQQLNSWRRPPACCEGYGLDERVDTSPLDPGFPQIAVPVLRLQSDDGSSKR